MAELANPVERREPIGGAGRWSGGFAKLPLTGTRAAFNVRAWPAVRRFVLLLAIVYLAKQAIYVVLFPAFSGHDEVAHYAHLQIVATEGRYPVVPDLAAWRAEYAATGEAAVHDRIPESLYRYCRYTTQDWFCEPQKYANNPPYGVWWLEELYPSGWIYTANHPPLYYILMTPVYWLSDGASAETQLFILRFAAIPFGLATVLLAFLSARTLFPGDGFLAVVAPAFVAFQTQVSYEAAMLNNDILSIALYSLIIYLTIVGIRDRFPTRLSLALGGVLGLALLAKSTSLTALGIVGLAVLLRIGWRDWGGLLRRALQIGVPMAVLIAPWYAYLYHTYGNVTVLPQINALQWWNEPAGSFFELLFDPEFAEMRFHETWGYWGWRLIPLSDAALWAIGIPLIVALTGLVQYAVSVWQSPSSGDPVTKPAPWQRLSLWMLLLTCVVAYLAIVQFGVTFNLTQARYFFPAVNAVALLLALGLRTVIPVRFHAYAQGMTVAALLVMNVLIFSQFVIPYWHLSFD